MFSHELGDRKQHTHPHSQVVMQTNPVPLRVGFADARAVPHPLTSNSPKERWSRRSRLGQLEVLQNTARAFPEPEGPTRSGVCSCSPFPRASLPVCAPADDELEHVPVVSSRLVVSAPTACPAASGLAELAARVSEPGPADAVQCLSRASASRWDPDWYSASSRA